MGFTCLYKFFVVCLYHNIKTINMSSKFIPNKGVTDTWSSSGWVNKPTKEEKQVEREYKLKKSRLHNTPLEDITFRDVWTLPLNMLTYGDHIYDKGGDMVAQFDWDVSDEDQMRILNIINTSVGSIKSSLFYKSGDIYIKQDEQWLPFITIRGWGGLTGVGGYNLPPEKATKIQDTFAEYLIKQLTNGIIR